MFLIPKEGLTVIDPALKNALPPEGRNVGDDNALYWATHIRDKSVTIGQDRTSATVEQPKAQPSKGV